MPALIALGALLIAVSHAGGLGVLLLAAPPQLLRQHREAWV